MAPLGGSWVVSWRHVGITSCLRSQPSLGQLREHVAGEHVALVGQQIVSLLFIPLKHRFTYKYYQCKWFCPCQMAIILLSQFVHTSSNAVKTSTHCLAENIFPFFISMRSIIIGLI